MKYISSCSFASIALSILLIPSSADAACTCPRGYSPVGGTTLICIKKVVTRRTANAACSPGDVLAQNMFGNRDACNTILGFGGNGKPTIPGGVFPPYQGWHLKVRSGRDHWWKDEEKISTSSCLAN